MGAHLVAHGDGVKDVSFAVEDLEGIMIQCKKKGVRIIMVFFYGWVVMARMTKRMMVWKR